MPGLPNKPVQVLPIKLYNNTGTATPIPFQQMITYDVSGNTNIRSDCANVWFTLYDGSVLKSWLEAVSGTWWIVIPNSIIANSSVVVYMNIGPATDVYFDGITIGCAPQLSATYGQYDNGANVFNFYDNFAGTALSSKWVTKASGTYTMTVNDGLKLSQNAGQISLYTSGTFGINNIFETYFSASGGGSGGFGAASPGISMTQQTYATVIDPTNATSIISMWGWGNHNEGSYWSSMSGNSSSQTYVATTQTGAVTGSIYSIAYLNDNISFYWNNYVFSNSINTNYPTGNVYGFIGIGGVTAASGVVYSFQWLRVRAYPPNGVMPYTLFPQPKENLILADAVI